MVEMRLEMFLYLTMLTALAESYKNTMLSTMHELFYQ